MNELDTTGCYDAETDDFKVYKLLEKGVYKFVIVSAEIKQTKKGDGSYLNVRFDECEGDGENSVVFKTFTLSNPSQKAVTIGKRQLAGLKHAIGKPEASTVEDFRGCMCWGEVRIEDGKDGHKDKNIIGNFKPENYQPESFDIPKTDDNPNGFSDTEKAAW